MSIMLELSRGARKIFFFFDVFSKRFIIYSSVLVAEYTHHDYLLTSLAGDRCL